MAFEQEQTWALRLLILSLSIGFTLYIIGVNSEPPSSNVDIQLVFDENGSISSGSPTGFSPIPEVGFLGGIKTFFLDTMPKVIFWTDYVWTNVLELPASINVLSMINLIIITVGIGGFLINFLASILGRFA